jgi:hypothetical protein
VNIHSTLLTAPPHQPETNWERPMDKTNSPVPNGKTRLRLSLVSEVHEPSKSNNAVTEASTPNVTDASGSILKSGE